MHTEKYTLDQMVNDYSEPDLNVHKLYSILKELGIVDETNRPIQKYIDEGYLAHGTPTIRMYGRDVQVNMTLVVGQKGIEFMEDILDKIYQDPSKIRWITGKKKKGR